MPLMTAHYSLRKGVKIRKEDFGATVFTPEWIVYTVNNLGFASIEMLTKQNLTPEEVIEKFLDAFPEESENIPRHIQEFVAESIESRIIVPRENGPTR